MSHTDGGVEETTTTSWVEGFLVAAGRCGGCAAWLSGRWKAHARAWFLRNDSGFYPLALFWAASFRFMFRLAAFWVALLASFAAFRVALLLAFGLPSLVNIYYVWAI